MSLVHRTSNDVGHIVNCIDDFEQGDSFFGYASGISGSSSPPNTSKENRRRVARETSSEPIDYGCRREKVEGFPDLLRWGAISQDMERVFNWSISTSAIRSVYNPTVMEHGSRRERTVASTPYQIRILIFSDAI